VSRWWLAALVAWSVAVHGATDETTIRVSVGGRVATLALEDYVARVVAGEGQPRAAPGAQEALAITARTYALANRNRHRREGFDLCDTTHCQVVRPATDLTRRAAQATAGRVLMHQGQPASVFYSALCGGHSELASHVWPGADDSSSHLQSDEACRDEPSWSIEFRASDIERALRSAGHTGRLRDVRVVQRNESGRVARVRVNGMTPNEVSGHDFRMAMTRQMGISSVKSTAFDIHRRGSNFRFSGNGFGHGVGLCVIGAGRRAAQGGSADAILRFYFPRLSVERYGAVVARAPDTARPLPPRPTLATPRATEPPAAKPESGILVTVANAASPDRVEITRHVRAARDRITAATGMRPRGEIQVVVHPTIDAFVRATGQPWWVSGMSDGTQIDLVPMVLLRQRAQVERTIVREVARLMIDSALADKPMWVREGAVAHFAEPSSAEVSVRGRCPADDELMRPVSAGAHRNALARAEACFRREIARGKNWRQIR
jgi:SpoIID/LytB domain protein